VYLKESIIVYRKDKKKKKPSAPSIGCVFPIIHHADRLIEQSNTFHVRLVTLKGYSK